MASWSPDAPLALRQRFMRCTAGALLALGLVSCDWSPSVRPIEPRRVVKGSYFVLEHEPIDGLDYVTVVEDLVDEFADLSTTLASLPEEEREELPTELAELPRELTRATPAQIRSVLGLLPRSILDVNTSETCRIPGSPLATLRFFRDPTQDVVPTRWRTVIRRPRDGKPSLELVDQNCKSKGPRLATAASPSVFTDTETLAQVMLVLKEDGELWFLDPWQNERRRVATDVSAWSFVAGPPNDKLPPDERGLLLLQNGELVVRRMDGTEIARFGEDVREFTQTSIGGLRVAYESGGAIFEVVAGDLTPVRLAGQQRTACRPNYSGAKLSFYFPCDEAQYTRLNLTTGELETFAPGVYFQYEDRGWAIEFRQPSSDDPNAPREQWVTPPGRDAPIRLETWISRLRPLDEQQLAGLDPNNDFGVWSPETGFTPILRSVATIQTFIDTFSTPDAEKPVFLWIVHHDVQEGVGKLSLLSAKDFSLEPIVEGVPIGGFTIFHFAALLDPALVLLRDLSSSGATLEARLIPDLLGSDVDDGVISFAPRADPLEPGLYYSVGPGEREGIWFAPL